MTASTKSSSGTTSRKERKEIIATDGIKLVAYSYGPVDPKKETILAVHGWPDNHHLWDRIAVYVQEQLPYNFIAYDVRGTGESEAGKNRKSYVFSQLASDIDSVITGFGVPSVHLVGHDWGGIQSWTAIHGNDGDYTPSGRIKTYTVISGPDLSIGSKFLRQGLPSLGVKNFIRQGLDSFYLPLFATPILPELLTHAGIVGFVLKHASRFTNRSLYNDYQECPKQKRDYINSLNLYRANLFQQLRQNKNCTVDIPIHFIIPNLDLHVSPGLMLYHNQFYKDTKTTRINGGHWIPEFNPQLVANTIVEGLKEFADPKRPRNQRLVLPTVLEQQDPLVGKLVLITGAGGGIGRCIAHELAYRGVKKIIVVDLNKNDADDTVTILSNAGCPAVAYQVDVSDAQAIEKLAEEVKKEHGVVDILVNNAGIGMAGRFLETSKKSFDKIMAVNLEGVINGCRVFGEQMARRGHGGRIINVSSASAFLPSKVMVGYTTTKASVKNFTEAIRADLIDDGIKVTAVCPGFVNTNLSRSTTYEGMTEEQQERARARAEAGYKKRNYTPEKTAKIIVKSLEKMPPVVVISPEAKLLYFVTQAFPAFRRFMARWDIRLK